MGGCPQSVAGHHVDGACEIRHISKVTIKLLALIVEIPEQEYLGVLSTATSSTEEDQVLDQSIMALIRNLEISYVSYYSSVCRFNSENCFRTRCSSVHKSSIFFCSSLKYWERF